MTQASPDISNAMPHRSEVPRAPIWPLLALATGAFAIGTSEFMPMGLMSMIARSLHVSVPVAGQLVSGYAVGVMVGAPIMTIACAKLRIHTALIGLMAIFTAGNLLSATAHGFDGLLVARIVTSLSHGAFFGLGAIAATKVSTAGRQGSAIATVFAGLALANIVGVPAATWIGDRFGWRSAFSLAVVLGAGAIAALWYSLPRAESGARSDLRRELRYLLRPSILLVMATTVMTAGAMFTLYTFVAPMLTSLVGASDNFIALCLGLIGVGFTVGTMVGGRLADWSAEGATKLVLAVLAVVMLLLPLLLRSPTGAAFGLAAWGAVTFSAMPSLQAQLMRTGSEGATMASSINIGAFNVGNAIGASVGAGVLRFGYGYQALPIAGAGCALVALAFAAVTKHAPVSESVQTSTPPGLI